MISTDGVNGSICLFGLSSDEKPTAANGNPKVPNGALWITIDDATKCFIYDKENDRWCKV